MRVNPRSGPRGLLRALPNSKSRCEESDSQCRAMDKGPMSHSPAGGQKLKRNRTADTDACYRLVVLEHLVTFVLLICSRVRLIQSTGSAGITEFSIGIVPQPRIS